MIRRPPRSTQSRSSAASDVYKRQIIYMLKGRLPWQGITAESKMEKHAKVLTKKQDTSANELCKGLPSEVTRYMYYCTSLPFEETPVYSQLYKLFNKILDKTQCFNGFEFDWDAMRCDLSTRTQKNKSNSNRTEREELYMFSKLNMSRKIEIKNLTSGLSQDKGQDRGNAKGTLLSSALQTYPEESKLGIKVPLVSHSSGLLYRKQGRAKISSQGSQEKTLRVSYKYFLANPLRNEDPETLCNFCPFDITERVKEVDETIPEERTGKDSAKLPGSYSIVSAAPIFRRAKALNGHVIKRAATDSKAACNGKRK
eukprot:TRINITY_DN8339_c0_g1_i1.p1 TRINITY_DN8339_c0_g1~~TRINITY_DN8339_c0_g1_i1.p1  ORF type:complete len:320 (+),score=97.09 TRINITY_DN8339_c0_g1_i1:27-962(+)